MKGTHAIVSLPWSWSSLLCQPRAGQTHSSPQCLGAATNVLADVAIDETVFAFSALPFAGVKPHRQPCRSSLAASSSHLPASRRRSWPSTKCRGSTCAIHSACVVQKFPLIVTMEISEVRLRLALPLLWLLLGNRRAEISGHLRPQDCQSLRVASDLSLQNFVDSRLSRGLQTRQAPSLLSPGVRLPPLLLPLLCVLPRRGLQLS